MLWVIFKFGGGLQKNVCVSMKDSGRFEEDPQCNGRERTLTGDNSCSVYDEEVKL